MEAQSAAFREIDVSGILMHQQRRFWSCCRQDSFCRVLMRPLKSGFDVGRTSSSNLEYPLALRASAIVIFAVGGSLVAMGLSSALGDATWSLSTGLGSCLVAGIYEVGRPDRLSAEEANQLDEQFQDFGEKLKLFCPLHTWASLPYS